MKDALHGTPARLLALVLLAQAAAYYAVASRSEIIPPSPELSRLAATSGEWTTAAEYPIEPEVQEVLKADDTLSRVYVDGEQRQISLFIAFFKTQRFGQAPHSPKNCLPGAGWQPTEDRKISLTLAGRAKPLVVNKYIIEKAEHKSLVLYWYQSRDRAIAGEFEAKFWLIADAIRHHRSDTALVRVITPIRDSAAQAEETVLSFLQRAYPDIVNQLPR